MCTLLCVKNTPEGQPVHFTFEAMTMPSMFITGFPGSHKDGVERWLAEQRDKKDNKDAMQFWVEIAILAFVAIEAVAAGFDIYVKMRGR